MKLIENTLEFVKKITNRAGIKKKRLIDILKYHPLIQETIKPCINNMPRHTDALNKAKCDSTQHLAFNLDHM